MGAAFRLADAAGLAGLVLCGDTPRPPHAKIAKTARATERSVPYRAGEDAVAYVEEARQKGITILALELTTESSSLFDYTPEATDIVLIAGNEATGIPPELLARCHASVHLPMHGQNSSMNVSVALGAAVYLLLMKLQ